MVVVTGAAGFIGSRCVSMLAARGTAVVSVDALDRFRDRPEHQGIDFGTLVDVDALSEWLVDAGARVTAIVHLGACTDTRETNRDYLTRVNLKASQDLWSHAARAGIPLIYASSAATYGDGTRGFDDDEALVPRLQPLNPYGESKQQFDCWALEQARAGHHPPSWIGLKFFNVYGPGERHKGPMASVVRHAFDQINRAGSVKLFRSHRPDVADGHQARDFIFVDDVVGTIAELIERPVTRGIFNLGSGTARTFLDLTNAVFQAMDRSPSIVFVDTPAELRPRYQYFTEARMGRLREAGYARQPTPLETGVERYVRTLMARPSGA